MDPGWGTSRKDKVMFPWVSFGLKDPRLGTKEASNSEMSMVADKKKP